MTSARTYRHQELAIQAQVAGPFPAPLPRHAGAQNPASHDVARWPVPRLIGQEELIGEICAHLSENVLLVSATGEAGIGTTAIARRVAREVATDFPDGCLLINLRSGGQLGPEPLNSAQIQRRVLRSLHAISDQEALPEDAPGLRRMYQNVLSERKALLVFDDAVSQTQLRYLLPQSGSAAIITTQHDLSASFPKVFTAMVKGLRAEDAYHLLGQVAPAASDLSFNSITPLVTRLQGIPLALRIVAPFLGKRSPLLPPKRLMASLDTAQKRFDALRGRDFPSNTVHIAIEVAYELMDPELKPYFEGLGVFPAPFTSRAAATVWNIPTAQAEDVLAQFAALALLDADPESRYYDLHHLVRLHAQELLLSQPDRARDLVSRYAEHYMREVVQASAGVDETEPDHEAPVLDDTTLWEHLPAAWVRAVGGDPGWPLPEAMERWICDFPLRSKAIMHRLLSRDEYRVWLSGALAAARALDDPHVTCQHLAELGRLSMQAGDHVTASTLFHEQADAARQAQDFAGEAEARMSAGTAHGTLGQIPQAEQDWQAALDLFEQIRDRRADRVRLWLRELRSRSELHS